MVGICGEMVSILRSIVPWRHSNPPRDRHVVRRDRVIQGGRYSPDLFPSMWDYRIRWKTWRNNLPAFHWTRIHDPRKVFWSRRARVLMDSLIRRCKAGHMVSMYGHESWWRKTYHTSNVGARRFTRSRIPIIGIYTRRPDDSHDGKGWLIHSETSWRVRTCCICMSRLWVPQEEGGWSRRRLLHMFDGRSLPWDLERISLFSRPPFDRLSTFIIPSLHQKNGSSRDPCEIWVALDEGYIVP